MSFVSFRKLCAMFSQGINTNTTFLRVMREENNTHTKKKKETRHTHKILYGERYPTPKANFDGFGILPYKSGIEKHGPSVRARFCSEVGNFDL